MTDRVLVVGAEGQLARALAASAPDWAVCTGRSRRELDVTDAEATFDAIWEIKPAWVINGTAYNNVDRAEGEEREEAMRVNTMGVSSLALICRKLGISLVHFSTDLVFDGEKRTPYMEDDPANPLSIYGASKLAGEQRVLAAHRRNLVIRVERLFGAETNPAKTSGNFPALMLRLARERGQVRVVNDQIGTPTYLPDLAEAVWSLMRLSSGGLYQLANAGEVSFAEYAREIFRLAGVDCPVEAVTSEAYGAAARRPAYSVMSSEKAQRLGVAPLRHWSEALAEFLRLYPPNFQRAGLAA